MKHKIVQREISF